MIQINGKYSSAKVFTDNLNSAEYDGIKRHLINPFEILISNIYITR